MKRALFAMILFFFLLCGGCQNIGCKVQREKCNYDCGDGLFGKLCKDACTVDYHMCKKR